MTENHESDGQIRLKEPIHVERISARFLATLVELGGDDALVATVSAPSRANPFLRAAYAWRRVMEAFGKKPWQDVLRAVAAAVKATIQALLPGRDRR